MFSQDLTGHKIILGELEHVSMFSQDLSGHKIILGELEHVSMFSQDLTGHKIILGEPSIMFNVLIIKLQSLLI